MFLFLYFFQLLHSFLELLCSLRLAAKALFLTPFQVREVRTCVLSFIDKFYGHFRDSWMHDWSYGEINVDCVWCDWMFGLCVREQWRVLLFSPKRPISPKRDSQYSPIFASVSCRSGEELQLWVRARLAQARRSRLGESAWQRHCFIFEPSPRRRELAWARDTLAWARLFCLSERLGERTHRFCFSLLLWFDYYNVGCFGSV